MKCHGLFAVLTGSELFPSTFISSWEQLSIDFLFLHWQSGQREWRRLREISGEEKGKGHLFNEIILDTSMSQWEITRRKPLSTRPLPSRWTNIIYSFQKRSFRNRRQLVSSGIFSVSNEAKFSFASLLIVCFEFNNFSRFLTLLCSLPNILQFLRRITFVCCAGTIFTVLFLSP